MNDEEEFPNDQEDDVILGKGDLSRHATIRTSYNSAARSEEGRGKEQQNLGYIPQLTETIAFDGIQREHGMHLEAHPRDSEGHLYKSTTEQVQPNEGRRLGAQGIEDKF